MSYPGYNGLPDIRARLAAVEAVDVSNSNDGIERVGNELRINYRDLPLAPDN